VLLLGLFICFSLIQEVAGFPAVAEWSWLLVARGDAEEEAGAPARGSPAKRRMAFRRSLEWPFRLPANAMQS